MSAGRINDYVAHRHVVERFDREPTDRSPKPLLDDSRATGECAVADSGPGGDVGVTIKEGQAPESEVRSVTWRKKDSDRLLLACARIDTKIGISRVGLGPHGRKEHVLGRRDAAIDSRQVELEFGRLPLLIERFDLRLEGCCLKPWVGSKLVRELRCRFRLVLTDPHPPCLESVPE